ncbi:MAG TPA: thioesterase family protein [Pseudonocardiaceae bacterium]|nr:thioesterase family protein [Pseudonocardiaceae bacterium]
MTEAFYLPLGEDRFLPTKHTVGPWSADSQHMGPPTALLTRAMQRCAPREELRLARVTVEILGPVPVAELQVRARVERPGRAVELVSAEILAAGRPVARAAGWRLATNDTSSVTGGLAEPMESLDTARQIFAPEGWVDGYLGAMEWFAVRGSFAEPGPAASWVRQRVALVDGEEPDGLQRLMVVADSGNGLSNRLDIRRWLFINTELSVHILREPTGEWIGLDAATAIGPNGMGTASSVLHDQLGQVGRGAQELLIRPR